MGIIVQKCIYDYNCSKCRGEQSNCVAYAQKKWNDVSVLNQKHLSELEELKNKIACGEFMPVVHGQWEFKCEGTYNRTKAYCTACGKPSGIGGIRSNQMKTFCPNCGVKMRVKQEV